MSLYPNSSRVLITCHANADFDAFASLIAASFLYPKSQLLFPGTQEKNLQKYYATCNRTRYRFVERDDIDWDSIELLVSVDTRQASRLQHVQALLNRPAMPIHAWDHHPATAGDIQPSYAVVEPMGACVTLLVRALRAMPAPPALSHDDATLMGLGLYGDTGSFTFSSTCPEDFECAAWLLLQGMDVNAIAEIALPEMTSLHVQTLNSLLESMQHYTVKGLDVIVATVVLDDYMGDFAQLAHRVLEMEKADALFAVGQMADRVQVVARSRKEAINVGAICTKLGGGGHAYAASASVRDLTLNEVSALIFQELCAQENPQKLASDYMSSPAIGIESTATVHEADELMLHFGLKAVPVFSPGTRHCAGIFDAQTAARATGHGLGNEPVSVYMQRNVLTISPEASLQSITDTIIGARQRLVPVVEQDEVKGVVTRTDLINIFADEPSQLAKPEKNPRKERSVAKIMQEKLPRALRDILHTVGALGDALNMPVYTVGGFVRDLLMEVPNQDIDLVVEGDGITFARTLAQQLNGRVREHHKFLTAVVLWRDEEGQEQHVDVATARLEYYQYPAALPTVELSSIKMDLFRRDFTINALAIRLSHGQFGRLVDFFGGQSDLRRKAITVLHTLSFVEDPTRCLRAVRFEQRYHFALSGGTERLFKNALSLNLMERLSGARLFHEIQRICEEENPLACFLRLHELGLLKAVSPHLDLPPHKISLLKNLQEIMDWYHLLYFDEQPVPWLVYLLGLCRLLSYPEAMTVLERLGLPLNQRQDFLQLREQLRRVLPKVEQWQQKVEKEDFARQKSALYALLHGLPIEGLLYLMAKSGNEAMRRNVSRYITQWRTAKSDINGADILALGVRSGPRVGEILQQVLAAKIDDLAPTRESQLQWALRLVAQGSAPCGQGQQNKA